jgi:hypothetical protein
MDTHTIAPFAIVNVLALGALTFVNLRATGVRASTSLARDSRRLRLALRAEMEELSSLLADNLQRLASDAAFLLSIRSTTVVYRANIARLNLLPEEDIPEIVSAYALAEKAEAFVSACSKAHGSLAYLPPKDNPDLTREIISQYERGQTKLREALLRLYFSAERATIRQEPLTANLNVALPITSEPLTPWEKAPR